MRLEKVPAEKYLLGNSSSGAICFDDVHNGAGLTWVHFVPEFANLYDDPRWLPFLESIGTSPEQLGAIEFNVTLPE